MQLLCSCSLFIKCLSLSFPFFLSPPQIWNTSLALESQLVARGCDPTADQGQNYYYNVSEMPGSILSQIPLDGHVNHNQTRASILQVCRGVNCICLE